MSRKRCRVQTGDNAGDRPIVQMLLDFIHPRLDFLADISNPCHPSDSTISSLAANKPYRSPNRSKLLTKSNARLTPHEACEFPTLKDWKPREFIGR